MLDKSRGQLGGDIGGLECGGTLAPFQMWIDGGKMAFCLVLVRKGMVWCVVVKHV